MQLNFNAFDYDPSQGGSICFPLADYKIEITAAEPKVVKDNPNAGYLAISLTVTEGDLRGLTQVDRLNLFHTNEVAKRIAHQQLAAYSFAINRPYLQNSEDLIGGRCICTIGPQSDNDKYSEVKMVKCMDGSAPTRPQQHAQQTQAAPPAPPAPTQAAVAPSQAPQAPPQAPQAPSQPPWNTAAPAGTGPVPSWANSQAQPTQPGNPAGLPPWAKA